jgi:hypothetical protein
VGWRSFIPPAVFVRTPHHERSHLYRPHPRVLCPLRRLHGVLREDPLNRIRCVNSPPTMENILIGFIALACLAYLVVAVLRPEKF